MRSADNILGWRSQFHRVERWFARLSEPVSDTEKLDFFLTYFINCYALTDWFIESGAISKEEMRPVISADASMCLCADICNRSKHLVLTKNPKVDAWYQIAREYDPFDGTARWFILSNGTKRDAYELATACMEFWRRFVRDHPTLPETSTPSR